MTNQRSSGTVTFLFTDIEGSTKLWETHRAVMQSALARHDALMRQAIESNRGYVFKTVGDAFCTAFPTAPDAACAALAAQSALSTERWGETPIKVRMALHSGNADERDGDYFGPPLNRVARLMCGHGGQVVLSQAVFDLVCDQLPRNVSLRDLGEHRLKDLIRPEHIYQLIAPDLPSEFPALKTLDALPNNLPIQLTSFIGREKEIEEIRKLLTRTRLLTLTGAGGCGKTRLAAHVAADVLDDFLNGVWFVELAPLVDPALVPLTIATVFGLREEQARPTLEMVTDYLREKNLLLVLDNCEHLIDAIAKLADLLLHACPKLKILASSREALGIAGEAPYRIPSLSLPSKDLSPANFQTLTQSEAVCLFIDRAAMLEPSFILTRQNAPAVAQVCQRLDGIPLALELAAARIKVLSVEQISKRLDDRFRLLTGGSRTALPRQQTLRALIDWSYGLLSEAERILLRRLSVFSGGWTLEAAQAVCSCDPVCADDVLDLLTRLVEKSLAMVDRQGDAARYRMMETIRQYARDKLLESGEGEQIRTRHLDFFLGFAEEAEPKLRGPEQRAWLERLDIEHDNLRGALEWSTSEGCVERGMRLAYASLWFWDLRAYYSEGKAATESLLMQPEASARTLSRANTLFAVAELSGQLGEGKFRKQYLEESIAISREQREAGKRTLALGLGLAGAEIFDDNLTAAQSMVEESLVIAQSLGEPWLLALTLFRAGSFSVSKLDHTTARNRLEESQKLFEGVHDKRWSARVSHIIAMEDVRERDFQGARWRLEKLLPFLREEKDKGGIRRALNVVGVIAHAEGQYDLAKGYYAESLENARDMGVGIFSPAKNLGCILLYQGEIESARTLFVECMRLAQEGSKAALGYAIQGYAAIAAVEKQPRRAITLFAASKKLQEEAADKTILSPAGDYDFARNLAIAREQVDEVTFNAAWEEGRAMTMVQAIEYALKEEKKEKNVQRS